MGIDYGEVRVGVALSDPLGWTASPHRVLSHRSRTKTLEAVMRIAKEFDICRVVVGLPTTSEGGLSQQAMVIIEWSKALLEVISLPIVFWDESYSSIDAHQIAKRNKRISDRPIDDIAAAAMLQSYLDSLQEGYEPGQTIEAILKRQ